MRALRPLILFSLAINAVPVIVTEIATVVATAGLAASTPEPMAIDNVTAHSEEAKLPESPEKTITSPPKKEEKKEKPKDQKPKGQKAKEQKPMEQKAKDKKPKEQKPKGKKPKEKKPKEQKYFHEPGWDLESGHYDARYFQGKVPYEQHRPALRHLIRSYLTTFKALGVETWLAHGSLLGWWWNGQIMPWDYDLDVQVSVGTLSFLGERYNRSTHEYEYEADEDEDNNTSFLLDTTTTTATYRNSSDTDDGGSREEGGAWNTTTTAAAAATTGTIKKTYLLDVNPHYAALTKGNGANIIDARWIDTSNGMFIDITGLRERDAERSPGVWSCKNNHRYRTGELWPLRRTEFEGAEAWIPYAFDKVLTDEYGPKSLVKEEWAGHRWVPELREWVKVPKKEKPASPLKEAEHQSTDKDKGDNKGIEKVIVYEEVIVEV
ncbi:LicD family-domain-containing protein [Xylaria sp. FL1777]|nr:LicD family-domain-containing protein [Xylaria sp. FL1777]